MVNNVNNSQAARQSQANAGTPAKAEKKKVNIDELIQAALRGKTQEKELTTKEKLDLVMQEFDTNKDGNISETEAEEGLKRLNAEQEAETPEVDKKEPTAYTVQNGEGFKSLIKRSLQGQGIENPTEEQMDEAIKAFKENPKNKGTFKTNSQGVTYLLVGKKVYIPGGLEDKNNADEQIMAYTKAMSAKHEAAKAKKAEKADGAKEAQDAKKADKADKTGKTDKADDKKVKADVTCKSGRYAIKKGDGSYDYYAKNGIKLDPTYARLVDPEFKKLNDLRFDKDGNMKSEYKKQDELAKKYNGKTTWQPGIYYDVKNKVHFKFIKQLKNGKIYTIRVTLPNVRTARNDSWIDQKGNVHKGRP